MQAYSPLPWSLRIAAAAAAVVVSTVLIGAQLSLFESVASRAAVARAKPSATPASSTLVERN